MVEIDGEKLMVSSSNFDDGSMIVSVGTTDFDNYGDSDFMEMMIDEDGEIDYFTLPTGKDDYQRMYKIKPSHYGRMKTQNETNESAGGDFIRIDGDGKYAESFEAELLTPKFKGHDKCVECGSIEIPLSEMDGGEIGLSDYYFSCAECDFSWYVAVRTDEHEDGSSAGIEFVGFMDEDGNILEEPQEFNIMGQPNPAYQKSQSESFSAEYIEMDCDPHHKWKLNDTPYIDYGDGSSGFIELSVRCQNCGEERFGSYSIDENEPCALDLSKKGVKPRYYRWGAESYSAEDNIIRFKVGERYTHRYHHGYGFRDNEVMRRTDKTVWTSQVNPETGELDSPLLVSRHKIHTSQPFELDGEIVSSYESYGLGNHAYRVTAGDTSLRTYDAESFAARGTYNLYKGQEKVLKAYRDSGGKENHYDSLPPKIVNKLESIRNSETLWSDVNRWLWDNPSTSKNPYGGFHSSWDAESFSAYEDPISDRQRYRIRKLGGRIEKSMNRSDASRYIKSLMADPLHAETQALDCSTCQGWGWNEDLNMVCDADGCIGGWVVPKKPSLLERGLELGAGVGMGMASVAIVFGILGGTVGLAAEELKKRRE